MGYTQSITLDHLQGRSTPGGSINRAVIVIGAPLSGVLADAVGYRPTLYAAAVGFGLVSASLAISPYRHGRLDDTARAIG
jgi:MFS family permease